MDEHVNDLLKALSDAILESNKYASDYGKLVQIMNAWLLDPPSSEQLEKELRRLFRRGVDEPVHRGMRMYL